MLRKKTLSLFALTGVLAITLLSVLSAFLPTQQQADASSHREAPLTSQDPVVDGTDLYAFVSPDAPDTVTFITNWIPYQGVGGPNWFRFGDDVLYEIHIDNVGDVQDRISFQFRFRTVVVNPNTFLLATGPIGKPDDAQYNLRQYMDVTRVDAPADGSCKNTPLANCAGATRRVIARDVQVAPPNIGPGSTPIYGATSQLTVRQNGDGIKLFAGPRADSFFADIGSVFDLLQLRNPGVNNFAGYNVSTISMQIPISQITRNGQRPSGPNDPNGIIGVWMTASRQTTKVFSDGATSSSGQWVQVQRLGMPLVNEVVVPLALKDAFNSLKPWQDATIPAVVGVVTDPEPARLLKALYGLNVPPTPRNDVLQVFAQGVPGLNQPPNGVPGEMLRLNTGIPPSANPNRLGVLGGDLAGFPNGRRLTDDVLDIELQVVAGALVQGFSGAGLSDNVNAPARPMGSGFPYQALPYSSFFNYPGTYQP
jgi:hypothetical protein